MNTPVAIALALSMAGPAVSASFEGEAVEPAATNLVALVCGWGTSSGGAIRDLRFCGGGGELASKLPSTWISWSVIIGKADAAAEGAPDVDFTRATFGAEFRFRPFLVDKTSFDRFALGAYAHRGTAIVSVEQLGGIDVVGVESGPGARFSATWAVIHGYPVKTTLFREWVPKAPKPQTGGACLSWGPIEFCGTRTKVGGRRVDAGTVKLFWLLGKRWG